MERWNSIFTKEGKVFIEPHPDMEELVVSFQEKNIRKILDLGCGTGRHTIYLSKHGFEVYGLDSAPKGLEIAQQWLNEEDLEAKLIQHRIEKRFPFVDEFFDAVISIQVIHHNVMKDILFTVKEIERVLKREGYIFLTFPILKGGTKVDEWELKEIEKGTYIPLTGPEKDLAHHFFTIEEIHEVFSSFNLLKIYIDKTKHRAILGIKK
ncbi:MAG: class I SAM-dependent methyltransferase [Candidatus Hodarchaeota archaeon]